MPRMHLTRAVGRLCDLQLPPTVSRAVVWLYAGAYGVDLAEALPPDRTYPSFDAFFTRRLREGARPLCLSPEALVSPADGRLDVVGTVASTGLIEVKGRAYRAADLLCSEAAAERYCGGQFAVIYLSPRDYHRIHAPAGGTLTAVRSRPGDLFPVNAIGERHIPRLLVRNRRVAMVIDTETTGQLTLVMVAAMFVGRITVSGIPAADVPFGDHQLRTPRRLSRGDELGAFHLGSTVVLFAEQSEPPWNRQLGPVRLGQGLTLLSRADEPPAAAAGEGAR